ncbi:MAG: O-antigen ligase family protein [Bacteroidota bacterium]
METTQNARWFYILSILFVAANSLFFYFDIPLFTLLPYALITILISLFYPERVLYSVFLFTPLSLNLDAFEIYSVGLYLPTEPLLFGVMLLIVLHFIRHGVHDRKIFEHPVSLIILLQLAWIFVTSVSSEDPAVSLKYFLARIWFVIPCYFLLIYLFKKTTNIRLTLWLYIIPFTLVIIYASINLWLYSFDEKAAHWVMNPFFRDHTSYGAMVAFYLPMILCLYFNKEILPVGRSLLIFIFVVFVTGVLFSYTRAAWVSLIGALGLFIILRMKIKLFTVVLGALAVLFLFFTFYDQIIMDLERNKTDSSDDITKHVESISNISSDASNLERLNRWNCALRMFNERPFLGWGPGTYQFYYAPFQHSSELTIISTNFGVMGNAHSEYLGPLAEQGAPGMIIMVLLVFTIIYKGITIYQKLPEGEIKILVLGALLGLTTYFIHGVLNNYLDTDKASVPFWSFVAIIVAAELYHLPSVKTDSK